MCRLKNNHQYLIIKDDRAKIYNHVENVDWQSYEAFVYKCHSCKSWLQLHEFREIILGPKCFLWLAHRNKYITNLLCIFIEIVFLDQVKTNDRS